MREGTGNFQSTQARHLFYLFLLALLVRFLYLSQLGESPFFIPPPGLDPSLYHQWAESIARGEGMGQDVFHTMPFYPYFLGFIYRMEPGLLWSTLIQFLLGAVSVVLIYHIGTSLFHPTVGWMAALGQTFSGITLFYEGLLVPATCINFLFIVTFLLLLRAAERQTLWGWFGAAFCLGLTTFAHAGTLLLLPFLLVWIFLSVPGTFLRKWVMFGLLLGCVLLAVFAIFMRNLTVAKDPVFFTAHSGLNFYIGNHSGASGRFQSPFSTHTSSEELLRDSQVTAERILGRPLKASDASQFWFRKGLRFIRQRPGAYLTLLSKKLLLFWNAYEIPDVEDYHFFRSRFSVLRFLGIPFAWIAPLGLLGVCVGLRQFRKLFLLYGFLFSQMIGLLLIFVNSRYRAPLVCLIILFASYALFWLTRLFRERRYRLILVAFVCLLHFVLFTHVHVGRTDESLQYYNIGVALDLAGEHDEAITSFQKALFVYPEDSTVLFALANAYFKKGELETARRRYQEVLLHDPLHADGYFNLGLLEFYRGKWAPAEKAFQESLALKGDEPDVHYLLSALYRKQGLFQKAEKAKQQAIALGADPQALEREPDKSTFFRRRR